MNYRIYRHIGTRWHSLNPCINEREHDAQQQAPVVIKEEKKKQGNKKHTDLMCLVGHFMFLPDEKR